MNNVSPTFRASRYGCARVSRVWTRLTAVADQGSRTYGRQGHRMHVPPARRRLAPPASPDEIFRWLGLALAVVITALSGCSGSGKAGESSTSVKATPEPTPATTSVDVYEPFAHGALASGITASATQSGTCLGGSIRSDRPDAWRCLVANQPMDPCFSSPSEVQLACPSFQNINTVTLIDLTQPLPKNLANPAGAKLPWRFQLSTGPLCGASTTASANPVDGMRPSGACGNSVEWFGQVNQSVQPWSVLVQSAPGGNTLSRDSISAAWE